VLSFHVTCTYSVKQVCWDNNSWAYELLFLISEDQDRIEGYSIVVGQQCDKVRLPQFNHPICRHCAKNTLRRAGRPTEAAVGNSNNEPYRPTLEGWGGGGGQGIVSLTVRLDPA
jgi:hypothetical protein